MHATSLLGDPADIESAVSCWKPNSADTRPWRGTTRVPEAKLDFLLHDLATHTRSQKDMGEPECPGGRGGYYWQDIVGWTRWGDLVVIGGVCREFRAAPNAFRIVGPTENVDTTAPFWHPSARGQRILDGLRR